VSAEPVQRGRHAYLGSIESCRSGTSQAVQVQLPDGAPALGPVAARALLRIIQAALVDSRQDGPTVRTQLRPGASTA
jgi:hypothetical protein